MIKIFVVSVICVVLSACSQDVYSNHFYNAMKACESEGGVSRMYPQYGGDWVVVCVSGKSVAQIGVRTSKNTASYEK